MEKLFKTPQEAVAQITEAYPYFSDYHMPSEQADILKKDADALKAELLEIESKNLEDEALSRHIGDIVLRALNIGVWDASIGDDYRARHDFAANKRPGVFMDSDKTTKILKDYGFEASITKNKIAQEKKFHEPIETFASEHQVEADREREAVEELLGKTIDIKTCTDIEREKIAKDFPGGNYLYHGTNSANIVKIFEAGSLMNLAAVNKLNDANSNGNSGFEGISWSLNGIDALPGDRYHIAGFMVAPEQALISGDQLAIPSRPAPNEVIQISNEIDASEFYNAKTQFELYSSVGIGENNSVISNLVNVSMWENINYRDMMSEPMLYSALSGVLSKDGYAEELKRYYSINKEEKVLLSERLLQQTKNEIPAAAVWLQSAIDRGLFKDTDFAGMELIEVIKNLNSDSLNQIYGKLGADKNYIDQIISDHESKIADVAIPVEDMYFVTSRNDMDEWLRFFARCDHRPAGIVLYDGEDVRLENFASNHRGDHLKLSDSLSSIMTKDDNYIDYSQVLGRDFNDDMRAGSKKQVIAEQFLDKRKVIKLVDGELSII